MQDIPQVQIEQPQVLVNKNRKKIWVASVLLTLLLIFSIFAYFYTKKPKTQKTVSNIVKTAVGQPIPILFQELTIPYLRKKEFKGKIISQTPVGNNGVYESYLAIYTSDGLKVNGLLTIPIGEKPKDGWPAIVFIHGYIPPSLYQTQGQYADYVDYLARNGFVVFKIDLRGHADSEGEAGGGYYGSDYISDTLNARSALQTSGFVNPEAIGLWGHSMAGNVVMRSMAARPEIPASVIWAGAVYTYEDMRKYGIQDNSYRPPQTSSQQRRRRQELFEKVGSPSASSPFWQQVAPTNYLTELKGAIQIHHAINDDVVNIGYSRDLMALLDNTNVPHTLFEYPSGGHNLEGISFNLAMQRTVEFFRQYLR